MNDEYARESRNNFKRRCKDEGRMMVMMTVESLLLGEALVFFFLSLYSTYKLPKWGCFQVRIGKVLREKRLHPSRGYENTTNVKGDFFLRRKTNWFDKEVVMIMNCWQMTRVKHNRISVDGLLFQMVLLGYTLWIDSFQIVQESARMLRRCNAFILTSMKLRNE